jgi:hypothetical protein
MKELTRKVALLAALKDAVEAELEQARAEMKGVLLEAHDQFGVKSVEVDLPSGEVVASVSIVPEKEAAAVLSEDEFTSWVAHHHPEQIDTRPRVHAAFAKLLLGRVEFTDSGKAVDTDSGEVIDGLGVRAKAGYVSVRFKPEGRELVAQAWRDRGILGTVMPRLDNPDSV